MEHGESAYRGGCAKGMPRFGACRRDCLHRAFVEEYRDARHAWEALRESDTIVMGVAGTAHAAIAAYQLTDEEFARAFPPPLFRDWLLSRANNSDQLPADAGDDDSVPYEQSEAM